MIKNVLNAELISARLNLYTKKRQHPKQKTILKSHIFKYYYGFLPYLRGMETDYVTATSKKLKVFTVPKRNGNTPLTNILAVILTVFTVPKRNGNISLSIVSKFETRVFTVPKRNGNHRRKPGTFGEC